MTPYVNFTHAVNTVDPATFGIPGDINTSVRSPDPPAEHQLPAGPRRAASRRASCRRVTRTRPGGTLFDFEALYPEIDFFAQDTWRVRPNITVDLGLRWELKLARATPTTCSGRPTCAWPSGSRRRARLAWVDEPTLRQRPKQRRAVDRRAWDPGGDGKSVFRGQLPHGVRPHQHVRESRRRSSRASQASRRASANAAYGQAGGGCPACRLARCSRRSRPRASSRHRPSRPTHARDGHRVRNADHPRVGDELPARGVEADASSRWPTSVGRPTTCSAPTT